MRILLATDAWRPQVNGVVRTWETSIAHLKERGHTVEVIEPHTFFHFPCPGYPEIHLCLTSRNQIAKRVKAFNPDAVHIATEGPVGLAMRSFCRRNRWKFSTSYHTKFPEYLRRMLKIPAGLTYHYMRWFHSGADATLVATPSLEQELTQRGFRNLVRWSRGVDLSLFRPRPKTLFQFPRPILLYAGRVSKEKSIEDFLKVRMPGTKVVVGDGPIRERLAREYPDAHFLGYRTGEALAEVYANSDLFVFPSKTDTFGLVIVEALASGLPVAAYPVVGPIDIVTKSHIGALDNDLARAMHQALETADPQACVRHAGQFTWKNCTDQLLNHLVLKKGSAL